MPSKCPQCGTAIADDAVFCSRCGFNVTREFSAVIAAADAAATSPESAETLAALQRALSDRYNVERELGRGGMATVYLAHDVKHDRQVAIKVLHPDLAASLGAERFEREIRVAAKLQHPNILGLYDSGAAGHLLYYVMPFVKGESVRDKLDREKMLSVEDAERVALEVADALGYAHAQGVVHRDIKPENIMLSNGHALVADFGIARAIGEMGSGPGKLTQTGMSVGTPVYMAPEQAAGEAAGPTADLYSLGCVLYEMLAGEPPFTGPNPMAIMARHLMEQVPSIRIIRSAVPEEIEQTIFAAMAKVPIDRPQTAAQFAEMMGLPLGSTATMRVRGSTGSMRRVTTASMPSIAPIVPWYKKPVLLIGSVVGVAAVAVGAVLMLKGPKKSIAELGPEARRIAVMYFEAGDSALTPLADGLTDGLIRSLSTAANYSVVSTAGAAQFRGSSASTDSIARALHVGTVVRGKVDPTGQQVRIRVDLYDGASGSSLEGRELVLPAGEVTRARDSVTAIVSDLIKKRLGTQLLTKQLQANTSSATAWLLVQRGDAALRAMMVAGDTVALDREYRAADSLYAGAQSDDPKWSDPLARRAWLAYRRSRLQVAAAKKWIAVGLPFADKALELDPRNADAFEARGTLKYWGWIQNIEEDAGKKVALILSARDDLDQAIKINPNQAGAYATISHLHYNAPGSAPTDIVIAAQKAYEVDEFLAEAEGVLSRLVLASYDLGQFAKAETWSAEATRRFPASWRTVRYQLLLQTTDLKPADVSLAWKLADSVTKIAPNPKYYRLNSDMLVAMVIARAAKSDPALADSARHVIKRSEGDAKVDPTRDLPLYGAMAATTLGDKAYAVRLLKTYFAVNPQKMVNFKTDPGWQFRPLSDDPEYRRLVGS